jgi:hypothetical protein
MQVPKSKIVENLYTTGTKFLINISGRKIPYIGYYHQINNKFYTGATNTNDSKTLFPITFKDVASALPFNVNILCFVKKVNENNIKKVGENEFEKYSSDTQYVSVKVDITDPQSIKNAVTSLPQVQDLINSAINSLNSIRGNI